MDGREGVWSRESVNESCHETVLRFLYDIDHRNMHMWLDCTELSTHHCAYCENAKCLTEWSGCLCPTVDDWGQVLSPVPDCRFLLKQNQGSGGDGGQPFTSQHRDPSWLNPGCRRHLRSEQLNGDSMCLGISLKSKCTSTVANYKRNVLCKIFVTPHAILSFWNQ